MEDYLPIVIDNGSYSIKLGFAGDDKPKDVFPSIIGTPKYTKSIPSEKYYIGDDAIIHKGMLNMDHPIKQGIIKTKEDLVSLEKIWNYAFNNILRVAPNEHPILVSEVPLNSDSQREKLASLLFETFNCPAIYFASYADLILMSSGRTIGLIVDIGYNKGHVVPIYEGTTIPSGIKYIDFGGKDITEQLKRLFQNIGYNFNTFSEVDMVREIKEQICYVALDFEKEMAEFKEKEYKMLDGNTLKLGVERILAPEMLFKPILMGKSVKALDEIIVDAISECDITLQEDLYRNIVLVGGGSMLPGLGTRLKKEIKTLVPNSMNISVIGPPERYISTWIGGSILASLKHFQKMWITKQEYLEGSSEIFDRCGEALQVYGSIPYK